MRKIFIIPLVWLMCCSTWALSGDLQQVDIDKFLTHTPLIMGELKKDSAKLTDAEKKQFQNSVFEGNPYSTMSRLMEKKPIKTQLDALSKEGGYNNFDQYAAIADRISSIIMSAQWIAKSAGVRGKDAEKIDNIYAYLSRNDIAEDKKNKLTQQLHEMYQKLNANEGDEDVVASNYGALAAALKMKR